MLSRRSLLRVLGGAATATGAAVTAAPALVQATAEQPTQFTAINPKYCTELKPFTVMTPSALQWETTHATRQLAWSVGQRIEQSLFVATSVDHLTVTAQHTWVHDPISQRTLLDGQWTKDEDLVGHSIPNLLRAARHLGVTPMNLVRHHQPRVIDYYARQVTQAEQETFLAGRES